MLKTCNDNPVFVYFDEAVIERCHYVNSQEERVEQVFKLGHTEMNIGMLGYNTIHISAYNPTCRLNAPLVRFKVHDFNYRIEKTAEIVFAANNIQEILPATLGLLENSHVNYFCIVKDEEKIYAYLMLISPHTDDYYYRIMFKQE